MPNQSQNAQKTMKSTPFDEHPEMKRKKEEMRKRIESKRKPVDELVPVDQMELAPVKVNSQMSGAGKYKVTKKKGFVDLAE